MKRRNLLVRILYFCGGIFIVNVGNSFLILAGLGTDAWNVFHLGLARFLPLSVGRISQGIGVIMILLGWVLKVKPSIGTFANMYLFGYYLDLILNSNIIKSPQSLVFAWIYLIFGTLIAGIGYGIYLNAKLGTGPRDSFMMGIVKLTGKSAGTAKTITEGLAVFIGWLLGGPVGIGTIVYTALVGVIMQWSIDNINLPEKANVLLENINE